MQPTRKYNTESSWMVGLKNSQQKSISLTKNRWTYYYMLKTRILTEVELEKEGPGLLRVLKKSAIQDPREDPLCAFVHGEPGTGKSRVIDWIIRLMREALHWEHGKEFVCVAFQNKVAYLMGGLGMTLHSCADIPIGKQQQDRKLDHGDVDILFTRNQHLRWILFDEAPMIPDELLGLFAANFQSAARDTSRYKKRADKSLRAFGGYNVMMFGDTQQIPPIPASSALFLPSVKKKSRLPNQTRYSNCSNCFYLNMH